MFQSDARGIATNHYTRGLLLLSSREGQRQTNLEEAIVCFQAVLQVYTLEDFPLEWAATQYNRGNAYVALQGEDWQENLGKAIICFHAALHILTIFQMSHHARVVTGAMNRAQETLALL